MASRIKIEDIVGQPITGSFLTITGAAGVDSHRKRLVTVDCSRCGSSGTSHRFSRVVNVEITSCGCASHDAHAAYRQRGVESLSPPQRSVIYDAVESGIPADQISRRYGRDKYTIHTCWQSEQARADMLPESTRLAIVWLGLSGTQYADLSRQFSIGVQAVAKIIAAHKRQQVAAKEWYVKLEYLLEFKVLSALGTIENAHARTYRRGEFLPDEFATGSRAKGTVYGPTYDTLIHHDPAGFTSEFRANAMDFMAACRFTLECRAARRRKHASSVPVPVPSMPEPPTCWRNAGESTTTR